MRCGSRAAREHCISWRMTPTRIKVGQTEAGKALLDLLSERLDLSRIQLPAIPQEVAELDWLESLVFIVPLFLVYAFACLSAWYLCRAQPLDTLSLPRLLASSALTAVTARAVWHRWRRVRCICCRPPKTPRPSTASPRSVMA